MFEQVLQLVDLYLFVDYGNLFTELDGQGYVAVHYKGMCIKLDYVTVPHSRSDTFTMQQK